MPHSIEITDADIEHVTQILRCCFAEANRRAALKCVINRDIQAGPGTGKTTLLVAKIAILSSKWRWRDRGICVLSHTNVARQEVQKRLAKHPSAHKLLSYPHFIGTIQTFFDRFLALPFLRNCGWEVSIIDNDHFAERALRLLPRYHSAQSYLSRRNRPEIVKGLRYELRDNELKLKSILGGIPGENTNTYRQLFEIKNRISLDGVFRFDDMYTFAEAYITNIPQLIHILRLRFPWVFIDEMQDTYAEQDRLLERIFGEGCILQKFGDSNQAIFRDGINGETETSFPKPGHIDLPESMRFGPEIAAFASSLTAVSPQILVGAGTHASRSHTIFLFDEGTIGQVLPAFGELLVQEYQEDFPEHFIAKAVGFRKLGETPGTGKIPFTLADYWLAFQPRLRSSVQPSHLINFIRKSRNVREEQRECKEAYDIIIEGVTHLLQRQGKKSSAGRRFTKTTFIDEMRKSGKLVNFQEILLDFLVSGQTLTAESWSQAVKRLIELIGPWIEGSLVSEAQRFLEWSDASSQPRGENSSPPSDRINIYRPNGERESLSIEITTIHAVKGETHTATLVLETYWYDHDLKTLLPFLKNQGTQSLIIGKLKERMKRIFVAMTRPKELICLALHKDHLTISDEAILQTLGWSIQDLTQLE